jgi:membrane protease YdiL (CAAX protease family)
MSEHPPSSSIRFNTLLAIEGMVLLLAVGLAWLFGVSLWAQMEWSLATLNMGVLATVPLVLLAIRSDAMAADWVNGLRNVVDEMLVPALRQAPPGGLLLLAVLAGWGEEWLFRGVIQGGLSAVLPPTVALIIAALLFGLAHAVSWAYFIAATLAGLYLGLLYQWSGNLLLPMLVHGLYDYVICLYVLRRR